MDQTRDWGVYATICCTIVYSYILWRKYATINISRRPKKDELVCVIKPLQTLKEFDGISIFTAGSIEMGKVSFKFKTIFLTSIKIFLGHRLAK